MAFTYTVDDIDSAGKGYVTGTYTSDSGSTGGDIVLPLRRILHVQLQPKGSAVSADQPVVNETLPLESTNSVTIVTSANEVGTFFAVGV